MELLTPGTGLLFWQVIIFLSTFFILSKYAWKPIMSSLKEREKFIEDSLDSAKKAEEELINIQSKNEELVMDARKEREKILSDAKKLEELGCFALVLEKLPEYEERESNYGKKLEIIRKERIRFYGVDAWEPRGEEREAGLKAKKFVQDLLPVGGECVVRTGKEKGKFGRYLGEIYIDDKSLNDMLLENGHAEVYK